MSNGDERFCVSIALAVCALLVLIGLVHLAARVFA